MKIVFLFVLYCTFLFYYFTNVTAVRTDIQRVIVEPFQHHDSTKDYCLEAYDCFRDEQFSIQSLPVSVYAQANLFSDLDASKSPHLWTPLWTKFMNSIQILKKAHTELNFTTHALNLTLFLMHFEAFQAASEWETLPMEVEHTLSFMPSCPNLLPGQSKWQCEPRWMYFRSLTTFSNIYCTQLDTFMQTLMNFFACQSDLPMASFVKYTSWFQSMKEIVLRTDQLHKLQKHVLKLHSHGRSKFILAHALLPIGALMHGIHYDLSQLVFQLNHSIKKTFFSMEITRFLKECIQSIQLHYQKQFQHRFQQLHAFEWILFKPSMSALFEQEECVAICMKSNEECDQLVAPCLYRYNFHSVAFAS